MSPLEMFAAAAAAVASVVSDSVCPQRQQPTRLPCPGDSPGKNTGVSFHFLLQCRKVKSESESEVVSDSSRPHGLHLPGSSVHGIFQARVLEWGAIAFSDICIYIHIYIHIHKSISEAKFKRLIMREGVNVTVYFFLIPPNWNRVYNDFCINVEPNSLSEQMASLILEGQKFHLFFSIRFSENPKWNFWSPQYF